MPIEPIEGEALFRAFPSLRDRLLPLVAGGPEEAVARLRTDDGLSPGREGGNCSDIGLVRDAIAAVAVDDRVAHGLVVSAPHTHWDAGLPIIISARDDGYLIGERRPVAGATYRPVSFVFSAAGPLAYEWIDPSVEVDRRELAVVWNVIETISPQLHGCRAGISVNYRFKRLFAPATEIPAEALEGSGLGMIRPMERFAELHPDSNLEQVAWHAYQFDDSDLTLEERRLYRTVRAALDRAPLDGQGALWSQIEGILTGTAAP